MHIGLPARLACGRRSPGRVTGEPTLAGRLMRHVGGGGLPSGRGGIGLCDRPADRRPICCCGWLLVVAAVALAAAGCQLVRCPLVRVRLGAGGAGRLAVLLLVARHH